MVFFNFGEMQEVRQNKKMIEQTNQKREQLLKSLDNDIYVLKMDINMVYQQIGKAACDRFVQEDSFSRDSVKEHIATLQIRQQELLRLEQKRNEIDYRYSEELEMLSKLIPEEVPKGNLMEAEVAQAIGSCPKCSGARMEGDRFCMNCGHQYE